MIDINKYFTNEWINLFLPIWPQSSVTSHPYSATPGFSAS